MSVKVDSLLMLYSGKSKCRPPPSCCNFVDSFAVGGVNSFNKHLTGEIGLPFFARVTTHKGASSELELLTVQQCALVSVTMTTVRGEVLGDVFICHIL